MPDADETAFNTAVRLLARRNHTRLELRRKLYQRQIDNDTIERILRKCERLGYLNEEETVRLLFRELKRKGRGPHRIASDMRRRGVDEALIREITSGYDGGEEELHNARKAVEKKIRQFEREKNQQKRREKIYRFLRSRGFSSAVVSQVLAETMALG